MADLKFTVDSALLRELGEKLVETVHLALVELVKNAYDADATKVEISFTTSSNGSTKIVITDNGTGMSFQAVQNYWMRIATVNKAKSNNSIVYGRPLTGAKGIGRFCCRRLGQHLTLITTGTSGGNKVGKQTTAQKTEVEFPWNEFSPGTDVTDVICHGDKKAVSNQKTGTQLIISEIVDEWTSRGYNWLKRQLAVLTANSGARRKGYLPDPGFEVKLLTPDFEEGIRDIREDFMEAGWGTLTAFINNKYQAVCELDALGLGKKKITSVETFPALKNISLKLAIFVDDREQLRDTNILSLGALKRILPEWGGVQVKYRGFRVFPYGDDDWLEIDYDRGLRKGNPGEELASFAYTLKGVDPSRSLLNLLSSRSYLGSVVIGENSAGFEMKLNREGFVASEAVEQLRKFVRYAIDWSTVLRDFYLRKQSLHDTQIAREALEAVLNRNLQSIELVDAAVDLIEKEVSDLTHHLSPEEKARVETNFLKATEAIRKYNKSNIAELAHLRIIASTSTLLLIFSHEVKSLMSLLEESKNSLQLMLQDIPTKHKKVATSIVVGFVNLKKRMEELLQLTSLVGVNKKGTPGRIALKESIIKIEKAFSLIIKKYEITVNYGNVPNNIVINQMLEAELYSVLLNVLSNSIKSVIAEGRKKIVEFEAYRQGGLNTIIVRDTGIGMDASRFDEVFIPFISDPDSKLYERLEKKLNPEDSLIVGSGSGLGLGIVREIVHAHGGSVTFKQPSKSWATELEIKLP